MSAALRTAGLIGFLTVATVVVPLAVLPTSIWPLVLPLGFVVGCAFLGVLFVVAWTNGRRAAAVTPPSTIKTVRTGASRLRRLSWRLACAAFYAPSRFTVVVCLAIFSFEIAFRLLETWLMPVGLRPTIWPWSPLLAGIRALVLALPLLVLYVFARWYVTFSAFATLGVRMHDHSDHAMLAFVEDETLKVMSYADLPAHRQSPEGLRVRCTYLESVFAGASRHFGVAPEVLENLYTIPVLALSETLERLVSIRRSHDALVSSITVDDDAAAADRDPLATERDALQDRLQAVKQRIGDVRPLRDEAAAILRWVVRQPSSGRALSAAAEIVAGFLLQTPTTETSYQVLKDLLSLRRGLSLGDVLCLDDLVRRNENSRHRVATYYKHKFPSVRRNALNYLGDHAVAFLMPRLAATEVIVTFGYSQTIEVVLSKLTTAAAKNQHFLDIWIVERDEGAENDAVVSETKIMMAHLQSRISADQARIQVANFTSIKETELAVRMGKVFLGADMISSTDGRVIHALGAQGLLETLLARRRSKELGRDTDPVEIIVFSDASKIIAPTERTYYSPQYNIIRPGDYDYLVTNYGVLNGQMLSGDPSDAPRSHLSDIREKWINEVQYLLGGDGDRQQMAPDDATPDDRPGENGPRRTVGDESTRPT